MSEHARVKDGAGKLYQWVDDELVILLDPVTGEPARFGKYKNSIGRFDDAMDILKTFPHRLVLIKLQCIACYPISNESEAIEPVPWSPLGPTGTCEKCGKNIVISCPRCDRKAESASPTLAERLKEFKAAKAAHEARD